MNRAERRKIMKKAPIYRETIKTAAKMATDNLEDIFKKKWEENDETLNEGRKDYNDDGEDDIYND